MTDQHAFLQAITSGYTFKSESVKMGIGMLDGEAIPGAGISLPLKTMNRHGLIAGSNRYGQNKNTSNDQ